MATRPVAGQLHGPGSEASSLLFGAFWTTGIPRQAHAASEVDVHKRCKGRVSGLLRDVKAQPAAEREGGSPIREACFAQSRLDLHGSDHSKGCSGAKHVGVGSEGVT